jgi:hypothetical protein
MPTIHLSMNHTTASRQLVCSTYSNAVLTVCTMSSCKWFSNADRWPLRNDQMQESQHFPSWESNHAIHYNHSVHQSYLYTASLLLASHHYICSLLLLFWDNYWHTVSVGLIKYSTCTFTATSVLGQYSMSAVFFASLSLIWHSTKVCIQV